MTAVVIEYNNHHQNLIKVKIDFSFLIRSDFSSFRRQIYFDTDSTLFVVEVIAINLCSHSNLKKKRKKNYNYNEFFSQWSTFIVSTHNKSIYLCSRRRIEFIQQHIRRQQQNTVCFT